jgi:GT2 family glycosyltransferase/glycosyltransferase involved in cell wall biosynthesis
LPLEHFLNWGKNEGRKIKGTRDQVPNYLQTPGKRYPLRVLKYWDPDRVENFLENLNSISKKSEPSIEKILVSVVMPTFNRAQIIVDAIHSVLDQEHSNLELLIIDDGSSDGTEEVISNHFASERRIRFIKSNHSGVSQARNIGLDHARGEYIFYLDSDNEWYPNHVRLLLTFMAIFKVPAVFSGSRCTMADGTRYYRGDDFNWNRCHELNYLDMNSFAHKASVLKLTEGFDPALRRLVDWDFILRMTQKVTTVFLPCVTVRYFDGSQHDRITKTVALDSELRELENYVQKKTKRTQPVAFVNERMYPLAESFFPTGQQDADDAESELIRSNPDALSNLADFERLRRDCAGRDDSLVSIIILCFNKSELTASCLASLFKNRPEDPALRFEVIVVDNASTDDTENVVRSFEDAHPELRYIKNDRNLMFALGNNVGAAASSGKYLLFLNNDTVVTAGWLESLLAALDENEDIGLVGPKLLYPDETIQCAGMAFNEYSSIPYHIYRGFPRDAECVSRRRRFKAITGACMLMEAQYFFAVEGFDPAFVNGCEDVDLCLKFKERLGKGCLYEPAAEIYHLEGKTEGRGKYIPYNRELMTLRWAPVIADDTRFLEEDGFKVVAYVKRGAEAHGDLAVYTPVLKMRIEDSDTFEVDGAQLNPVCNVGFVTIWHVRGISIHTLQIARALEGKEIRTHIFARWESARFANDDPVKHPRVTNGGDDPSPDELSEWCRKNDISVMVFMEVHPNDWKRVDRLKKDGVKVIAYENLDILRKEFLNRYGRFDGFLFNTFYTREVFKRYYPATPSITVPWGVTPPELHQAPLLSPGEPLKFVHVAGWGGVNNRKNTSLLIDAFNRTGDIDAELHLYSQSPVSAFGANAERVCRENPRIHVTEGTVEDIFEAYVGKHMLLWPSKREGVGLPILEALVCGLPVLVSDGFMMKQWIQPGVHGVICPASPEYGQMFLPEMQVDIDRLADMIRDLANDRQKVQTLIDNVRRDNDVWHWSWQAAVLRKMFRLFEAQPENPAFHALNYIPSGIVAFEEERRRVNHEPCLG